jgi:hypothetical protein
MKYKEYIHNLSDAVYEEIKDKTAKKLRCINCPSCGKLNFFRFVNLNNSSLECKECNTPIRIEEEWIETSNKFLIKQR